MKGDLSLLLALMLLVLFIISWHNLDNAFNLHTVNCASEFNATEHNYLGIPIDEYHLHGISMVLNIISFVGIFTIYIFGRKNEN